jgi:outer membrane receptor protein involved in Fe transport
VGGLYYYNKLHDLNSATVYATPTIPLFLAFETENHKRTLSLGVFAEGTYSVASDTRITGGVRYDYTKVRNDQTYQTSAPPNTSVVTKSISGDEATRRFRNVTYKARIEHDLAPANMVYASVATGVSPGDIAIATSATSQPQVLELDAQTLTAFELGSKNRFFGSKLQVNGAVFYNNYSGYQLANVNLSGNAFNPLFATVVAKLRSYGFEFDAIGSPWENGRFIINMSYTNSRLGDVEDQYQKFFARSRVPGVAPFQATAAYSHDIEFGSEAILSLYGELRYLSSYDASRFTVEQLNAGAAPFVRTGDEFLGNLSATLAFQKGFSLTGYVRNIGNNRYKTDVASNTQLGPFGNVIGHSYETELYQPRTYGVIATVKF